MRLVNGHYCANCAEELLAKRGLDPTNGPHRAELKEQTEQRTVGASAQSSELGVNRPEGNGQVGSQLNLYA